MDLLLQIWGSSCYLANKVLFSVSESRTASQKKTLKTIGWVVYIIGVPAWVTILIIHNNWIAASIEAGGIPAMLLGLYNTIHNHQKVKPVFNKLVALCTYASLAFGISFSLYHHGGITSITQILEVGVMLGFLLGSYWLAKGRVNGWLFFMLMNISMASLMLIQQKPILMAQQLLSLCFVLYGYVSVLKAERAKRISGTV